MRLAFICGFAWEPKGTVRLRAFPLAAELVQRGHQVTIFLTPYDNRSYSGKEWWNEGVHIVNLTISRWAIGALATFAQLIGRVRTFNPDVLHIFKPKGYAGAAAEAFMAISHIPIVLDCDDWEGWGGWNEVKDYPWLVKQYIDWQECRLIRRAEQISVASRVLLSRATTLRGATVGITYLPNCISRATLERLEAVRSQDREGLRAETGLPREPVILYVGHYEGCDDVMFFAEAGAVAARITGATLAFVGDGEQLSSLRKYFEARPDIHVQYFGQIPYEPYLKLLAASDVAAFPYPDNPVYRAKCSVRIIEFLAMGTPVLTTDVGQNREYIEDGVNGRLCSAGDLSTFAGLLVELVRDQAARARIGEIARRRVRKDFIWDLSSGERCEVMYRAAMA